MAPPDHVASHPQGSAVLLTQRAEARREPSAAEDGGARSRPHRLPGQRFCLWTLLALVGQCAAEQPVLLSRGEVRAAARRGGGAGLPGRKEELTGGGGRGTERLEARTSTGPRAPAVSCPLCTWACGVTHFHALPFRRNSQRRPGAAALTASVMLPALSKQH